MNSKNTTAAKNKPDPIAEKFQEFSQDGESEVFDSKAWKFLGSIILNSIFTSVIGAILAANYFYIFPKFNEWPVVLSFSIFELLLIIGFGRVIRVSWIESLLIRGLVAHRKNKLS